MVTRKSKRIVALTLFILGLLLAVTGWFLTTITHDAAAHYASIISTLAAIPGLSGVVFGVLALNQEAPLRDTSTIIPLKGEAEQPRIPPQNDVAFEQLPAVAEVTERDVAEIRPEKITGTVRGDLKPASADPFDWVADAPDLIHELDVLVEPSAIRARWASNASQPIRAFLGLGEFRKRVLYDLVRDGTGVAIIGTPGSGVSVLLQSIAVSLAIEYPPSRVRLHLLDAKGWMWQSLESLPHVDEVLEPKDRGYLTIENLGVLGKILEERRSLFRAKGVRDIGEYNLLAPQRLPWHVLLVDAVSEVDTEGLKSLLLCGRSVGIAMVVGGSGTVNGFSYQAFEPKLESVMRSFVFMGPIADDWIRRREEVEREGEWRLSRGRALWVAPDGEEHRLVAVRPEFLYRRHVDSPYMESYSLQDLCQAMNKASTK